MGDRTLAVALSSDLGPDVRYGQPYQYRYSAIARMGATHPVESMRIELIVRTVQASCVSLTLPNVHLSSLPHEFVSIAHTVRYVKRH